MGYLLFLLIPLTIFVLFVLPIWLWLHYNNQNVNRGQLGSNEIQRLEQLTENARRMQERIKTLEDILDAEHPNWRQS
ncbi:envelope stress response membrane protein PspB [Xenorhabdus sp. Reich]|uniref:Envelope stress response membrane protein PspB n=1 Tax=Xenorhabdus littoralis TaxID=2582835 RepID=A0ABU4SPL1_9GAMM|nr:MULTISPECIES: envelope stress response membrane protein PspB [unclassified Xenorhabdus]MDX7990426.1 envelope stress response membrane protein PspB [Xenorhabdus sp. psl]MDX8000593.1 envelope stress response membrane protein PspB [Xenorhabdus sp. Reich]